MSVQIRDEKKEIQEKIRNLSEKDYILWDSIDRRHTFRGLRHTLARLKLPLFVPMNNAEITAEYCKTYGDPSVEQIQTDPRSLI